MNILKNFNNLTTLSIATTNLTSVSAIAEKTTLTTISITSSKLTDISQFAKMTSLTSLTLSKNYISTGFRSIEGLTNLQELVLNNNSISDYDTYVETVDGVEETKTYKVLSSFKTLKTNGALTSLNLKGNYISNFDELNGLTGLNLTK